MADVFKVIFQLEADSTGVLKAIDSVGASYQKVNEELKKQEAKLNKLLKTEAEILAARKKTNSPSEAAKLTNQLTKNKAAIDKTKKAVVDLGNAEKKLGSEAGFLGKKLDDAFKVAQVKGFTENVKKAGAEIHGVSEAAKGTKLDLDPDGNIINSKKNLLALKKELKSLDTESEEADEVALKMRKIEKAIREATEARDAFASGNAFKTTGKILGEIGHDILSFDFKGAATKAELLNKVASKISFADVAKGAKQLGTTLANVGKALLKNPLFLLATVLLAAYEAMESFSEAAKKNTERLEENEKMVESLIESNDKLRNEIQKSALEYDVLAGKRSKTDAEIKKNSIGHLEELAASNKKFRELEEEARKKARSDADEKGFFAKRFDDIKGALGKETDIQIRTKDALKDIAEQQNEELLLIDKKYQVSSRTIIQTGKNETLEKIKKANDDELNLRKQLLKDLVDADKTNTDFFNKEREKAGSNDQIKLEFDAKRNLAKEEFAAKQEEVNKLVAEAKKEGVLTNKLKKNFANDRKLIEEKLNQDIIQLNQEQNLELIKNDFDLAISELDARKAAADLLVVQAGGTELQIAEQKLNVQQDYFNQSEALQQANIDKRKGDGFSVVKEEKTISALRIANATATAESLNEINKLTVESAITQINNLKEADQSALKLKNARGSELLFAEVKFEMDRLEVLKAGGKQYEQEAIKQQQRLDQLEKDAIKARRQENIGYFEDISNAAISATSKLIDLKLKENERLSELQSKRVEDAKIIAADGNAELLQEEKKRLDDLNKEKEKYVRAQQALAVVELIAQTAVMIAKAAAETAPASAIGIATALLALGVGLASARAIAGQAAFYEGGYTGSGNPRETSNAVGPRPYVYHKDEFVMNHKHTRKYKDIFQGVHDGRIDLRDWSEKVKGFDSMNMKQKLTATPSVINNSIEMGQLRGQMEELISVVKGQSTSINLDDNGFAVHMKKVTSRNDFIRNNLAKG